MRVHKYNISYIKSNDREESAQLLCNIIIVKMS